MSIAPGLQNKSRLNRSLRHTALCPFDTLRRRLADLAQWIWDEFALSVTRHTLGRELRAMGYRKLSARPRHRGQKPDDIVDFNKALAPVWSRSSGSSPRERQ